MARQRAVGVATPGETLVGATCAQQSAGASGGCRSCAAAAPIETAAASQSGAARPDVGAEAIDVAIPCAWHAALAGDRGRPLENPQAIARGPWVAKANNIDVRHNTCVLTQARCVVLCGICFARAHQRRTSSTFEQIARSHQDDRSVGLGAPIAIVKHEPGAPPSMSWSWQVFPHLVSKLAAIRAWWGHVVRHSDSRPAVAPMR